MTAPVPGTREAVFTDALREMGSSHPRAAALFLLNALEADDRPERWVLFDGLVEIGCPLPFGVTELLLIRSPRSQNEDVE